MIDLLKEIPSDFYVAIGTAGFMLLGICITNKNNIKRIKMQHEHEKELKNKELMCCKIEELYLLTEKYLHILDTLHLSYLPKIQGQMTNKEAFDLVKASMDNMKSDSGSITMLTNIYCPEVISDYDVLNQTKDKMHELISFFIDKTYSQEEKKEHYQLFRSTQQMGTTIKDKIAKKAKAIINS